MAERDDLMDDGHGPNHDELGDRRERRLDQAQAWLGPKGQALWAALEERDRQRPGEPDEVYKARMILTVGAAEIRLGMELVAGGYMPASADPGLPLPGTGCPAKVREGVRCGQPPREMGLCGRHFAEFEATATAEEMAELRTVHEGVAKLDQLDRPSERDISWARNWAYKLGLSLTVNRTGGSAPRFWLYTPDRTRLVAGGTHGMTFSALVCESWPGGSSARVAGCGRPGRRAGVGGAVVGVTVGGECVATCGADARSGREGQGGQTAAAGRGGAELPLAGDHATVLGPGRGSSARVHARGGGVREALALLRDGLSGCRAVRLVLGWGACGRVDLRITATMRCAAGFLGRSTIDGYYIIIVSRSRMRCLTG